MQHSFLRLALTAAILVGLAAAPNAQVFTWQAGHGTDAVERARRSAERAADQARHRANHLAAQIRRNMDRLTARRVDFLRGFAVDLGRGNRSAEYAGAERQVGTDADPCRDNYSGDRDYERTCEVRESTMPAGPLTVDAGPNGGIQIEAWDRSEIAVRAIVQASAREAADARRLAGEVQVQSGGGRVYATGPENRRNEWWSVSYRINVPKKNDLDLRASNGGITIIGVSGNMRFDTTNGGVRLQDVGGRVNGETRNGGLNVMLNGNKWDGEGLDVETSNGGVNLAIPDGYNAELETRTVNGGLRIDFPITVQGELTSRRGISTTLGSGGPLVRVRTTNGGVTIKRR